MINTGVIRDGAFKEYYIMLTQHNIPNHAVAVFFIVIIIPCRETKKIRKNLAFPYKKFKT